MSDPSAAGFQFAPAKPKGAEQPAPERKRRAAPEPQAEKPKTRKRRQKSSPYDLALKACVRNLRKLDEAEAKRLLVTLKAFFG